MAHHSNDDGVVAVTWETDCVGVFLETVMELNNQSLYQVLPSFLAGWFSPTFACL